MRKVKVKSLLGASLLSLCSILHTQVIGDSLLKDKWFKSQKKINSFAIPKSWNLKPIDTELFKTTSISENSNDFDQDGLTNTEEIKIKSNPLNYDTDGDALPDGWEVNGIAGVNLRAMGASPLHKDIFVEMDYMTRSSANYGLAPSVSVLKRIEDAFSNAPVDNPDGTTGINIHLIIGDEIPYVDDLIPYDIAFYEIKSKHFNPKLAPVFHYMIWANAYDGQKSSGISMNIPSSDFIVTLGRWNKGNGGTDDQKVGTFIHELGHNLGLMHGGSEHLNYKPNHLSVMNYFFQMEGIRTSNGNNFTYQPFAMRVLDERNLTEDRGLGKDVFLDGYYTKYFDNHRFIVEVPAASSINWNKNSSVDPGFIKLNLNGDYALTELMATFNEWKNIQYNGGSIGQTGHLKGILETVEKQVDLIPMEELTEEQFLLMKKE